MLGLSYTVYLQFCSQPSIPATHLVLPEKTMLLVRGNRRVCPKGCPAEGRNSAFSVPTWLVLPCWPLSTQFSVRLQAVAPAMTPNLIVPTVSLGQGQLHNNFQNPIQNKNVKPLLQKKIRKFKMVRAKRETEHSSVQWALRVAVLMDESLLKGSMHGSSAST